MNTLRTLLVVFLLVFALLAPVSARAGMEPAAHSQAVSGSAQQTYYLPIFSYGLSAPFWVINGEQPYQYLGSSVSGAGDVNGDGYTDVLAGASGSVNNPNTGAYLYMGRRNGVGQNWDAGYELYHPDWQVKAEGTASVFGSWVSSAGDVNHDGFADVIVVDSGDNANGQPQHRVNIYYGSAQGLAQAPDWTHESIVSPYTIRTVANGAGDVNGDGFDDVLIESSVASSDNGEYVGQAFAYYGSAAGLGATPEWTVEGILNNAYYGPAAAGVGDVNCDGFDDVMIGSPGAKDTGGAKRGRVNLYYGSALGLRAAPDWTAEGEAPTSQLGAALNGAGDVNGDGFADVIVGAGVDAYPDYSAYGSAYVYYGSANGLGQLADWSYLHILFPQRISQSLDGAGDVNGDGFDDIVLGTIFGGWNHVLVFHGSAAGLNKQGPSWFDNYILFGIINGIRVSGAGDINRDGYGDVVVGTPSNLFGGAYNTGRVYVLFGSPDGLKQ